MAAQRQGLPGQRAGGVQQAPPQLAALPETVVAGIVIKAQKDGQRDAEQRKRSRVQRHFVVVEVTMSIHHGRRKAYQHQQPEQNLRQHRAVPHKEQPQPIFLIANNHARGTAGTASGLPDTNNNPSVPGAAGTLPFLFTSAQPAAYATVPNKNDAQTASGVAAETAGTTPINSEVLVLPVDTNSSLCGWLCSRKLFTKSACLAMTTRCSAIDKRVVLPSCVRLAAGRLRVCRQS